jgi:hypothetical protein
MAPTPYYQGGANLGFDPLAETQPIPRFQSTSMYWMIAWKHRVDVVSARQEGVLGEIGCAIKN